MNRLAKILLAAFCAIAASTAFAQFQPVVPKDKRGRVDAERRGFHDANNIRTEFWNYGMVGNYPPDPGNVDLSVFHSVEVPKGSGMNYSDGITPFVLAKIRQRNGSEAFIMETGYRERQSTSPLTNRIMRFEPRPGYFQPDPNRNRGRSPASSNDPRTWPDSWPDKENDRDDPGWRGSWNGYFGKRANADQESYTVMDDDFYDAWDFFPDSRDPTRRGLGLRVEVRGFQWANPQAQNVIFWHYDITNEGTTDYNENIIFGLYFDSGVGGSALSCDGVFESDDDNAFYDRSFNTKTQNLNLVYTWDKFGHGRDLSGNCGLTGYLGYAYLETPGKPGDGIDNDNDGIIDEKRDGGPGLLLTSQPEIEAYVRSRYDVDKFNAVFNDFKSRPAYRASRWWTGDEDLDWIAELHDTGADGVFETNDTGEGDGVPTNGEPNFDRTDLHESDQIGLTGFKFNRIRAGAGNPSTEVDNIVFYAGTQNWPRLLYEKFTDPVFSARFDTALALNYNIGFVFASGPFTLPAGKTERFSLALAYGADLTELRETVKTVQKIYNANYQFATPPEAPTVTAETGDGYVRLSWDDLAERGSDPVTLENDFEGYRIYRATDPEFRDVRVITTGRGTGPIGNGKPLAQFDLVNGKKGFSRQVVEGVAYYLGNDTGIAHTFTDTTVTNGQLYYYAVCAYDHGSDSLDFYPSENSIAVSRTPRGGTILPKNVVAVRPNPKVAGFVPASVSAAKHTKGSGVGSVELRVVNSELVPDNHVFNIKFRTTSPDSIRAYFYDLIDSTTGKVVFTSGTDLDGKGSGPVGAGLLPVVATPSTILIDSARTGFTAASRTNTRLKAVFQDPIDETRPDREKFRNARLINLRRTGFPNDITITFSDTPVDTSINFGIGRGPRPAKFRVVAHTPTGDIRLKFGMADLDRDGTLSRPDDYIAIITELPGVTPIEQETWRVQFDTTGQGRRGPIVPPREGDVYKLVLRHPLSPSDVFSFRTTGQRVDAANAKNAKQEPYVVPNPYVGSASFEAERFAISGRGERRMEFRALPQNCTIRIYTVRGELVQTLRHDGSNAGYVAWDLRTKDNLDVAPGLYIFHVDGGETGEHVGKFAIIK
jgi:hypothetical protein